MSEQTPEQTPHLVARIVVTYVDGRGPVVLDTSDEAVVATVLELKRASYPRAFQPWRPDEEATLARLHGAGMTSRQIADEMGRQVGGIRSRLRKLGLID